VSHAFVLGADEHDVGLARTASGYALHVGGEAFPVALHPGAAGVHELSVDGRTLSVAVAVRGDEVHVHLRGRTFSLRYLDPLERFAGDAESGADRVSRAPMPGAVISVAVRIGERVERGQVLMVIESMKMETPICAARDGVVQALHVDVGRTFERDAPLATIEPDERGAA